MTAVLNLLNVIAAVKEQGKGVPIGYHFIAVMDDSTCPICSEHHCKVYPRGDEPRPPLHPNCRCYLEPVFKELKPIPGFIEHLYGVRRVRFGERVHPK